MLNELAYAQGIEDGMAKFAISRFRQYARDITQAASRSQDPAMMAKAQGAALKAYPPKVLGTGQEGTAVRLMMPQAAEGGALTPTVRKTFNPNAPLASPELIKRRMELGPTLNETGNFAKFYGGGQTAQGRQYIDSAFVPGKIAPGTDVTQHQTAIDRSLRAAGKKTGLGKLTAKDIRGENLGVDPRTGKTVALDYMPFKRTETYDPRYNRMSGQKDPTSPIPTHEGAKLFPNTAASFADPGGRQKAFYKEKMKGRMASDPKSVLPGAAVAGPEPFTPQVAPAGVHVPGESVFGSLGGTQAGVLPQQPGTQAGVLPQPGTQAGVLPKI